MNEIDKALPKDERILLAAKEVFSRKGYLQASLDEIIELADTGKGTVYNYFKNKDNLFYTLANNINTPFVDALQKIYDSNQSVPDKLEQYLCVMIDFLRANDTLWQVLFYEMLGANKGWHLLEADDGSEESRVIVKWGAEPTEEEIERIKKYYFLTFASFKILDKILIDGVEQQYFKTMIDEDDIHYVARHLYGGICMTVFFSIDDLKDTSELAKIITERFLFGFANA
ncbi:MAG TPA: TetR/AcrR family transcriptional regulator [Candidatus Avacidaminococcus intestinavium]|uniref:TetR/AcrR family transcriptional regulator n=1 Tax=Candidatus Avacidaminococcus intestinavium TaxID=2840684 RepID=A0A9D1MP46_9FIRM|nr:TetR/AcrR family transcriptional regulator [Candidatus Avacidaminococcus intestinavium]